ncbi:hypothetical protein Rsub_12777 [Raphidocelis subcapitata]|uniref:DUF2237 domain-containing protein n=1 Tax=Raphidocelis subcapitata TaxID=307507 RepID=A0A2V0PKJ9_9CHLO|nr:hypothetical protein Rsub_12777 [Raphidocelis subcapitata]|eukprot:GBG00080.1 hypothetical protein Rsub_12777 [Raphidocelis subcapitata]
MLPRLSPFTTRLSEPYRRASTIAAASGPPQAAAPVAMNVLGGPLKCCCAGPKTTGYYRDGYCRTGGGDYGVHSVCAQVTAEFLAYTASRGNDLSTPSPFFPGLKPGDRWCLCASRWQEAKQAGAAPPVVLAATHVQTLDFVSLEDLKQHAVDADEAEAEAAEAKRARADGRGDGTCDSPAAS